jgi:Xaa-Pro dipeptidase
MNLPLLHETRSVKSKRDIEYIRRAQKVSEDVIHETILTLKKGITEIEVQKSIIRRFKAKGIKVLPFLPIVAFGKGTAHVHHEANSTRLKNVDIVMIDLGAVMEGYCSDMTRTYFFNEPSDKVKKMYDTVQEAKINVLKAIKRGERVTGKLDKVARSIIEKRYGKLSFPHTLGHGVGTAIHEWPILRSKTKDCLRPGMVITIEPGVYIKNLGGVRIEDLILITKDGYQNLCKLPSDYNSIVIKNNAS